MQLVVLATLVTSILGTKLAGSFTPRLPESVINNGKFQLIPDDKIVGGSAVVPHSLPFQISLQRTRTGIFYSHICGASILDELTILSAAHCVIGADSSTLRIVAGAHKLSDSEGQQKVGLTGFIIHEDYNRKTLENDIAIIKLAEPLNFSSTVQPVNLPPPTSELDLPAGFEITVSGWGTTSEGGSLSDILLSVQVPIVSDLDCNNAYSQDKPGLPIVHPSMICAGSPDGGIDGCQGDSGGPVFVGTGTEAVQHGIVSWGFGCAQAAYPGVNTQVSFYLDWIQKNRNSSVTTFLQQ